MTDDSPAPAPLPLPQHLSVHRGRWCIVSAALLWSLSGGFAKILTQPTPLGGMPAQIVWPIPKALPPGDYVAWVEVGKAFDANAVYNATTYPPPSGIPWTTYGQPYRGQPSIVYRVPFTIGTTETMASIDDYAGYGDPGLDPFGQTTGTGHLTTFMNTGSFFPTQMGLRAPSAPTGRRP